MQFTLKDYQEKATSDIVKILRRASRDYIDDQSSHWAVSLSAPTGAGKTVIASAVIETLFYGSAATAGDPEAIVLWVTDDPALNEQTKRKMLQAASKLAPANLVTIDSSFDAPMFSPGRCYFLNIQKLARTNPLARSNSDSRTYSLWQTIANTIAAQGAHFYVVIDEAHKGMKSERDRQTIVSRIINGQPTSNPPAPIVWGISATPQRFTEAIGRWAVDRTMRPVTVPVEDVRASGLLKDLIVLDNPADGQQQGDTTLTRAAVARTLEFESAWASYATSQDEPPVRPILVIQLHNTPSEGEIGELLGAIFSSWPGLRDYNVVNTFGEHTAINIGGHLIKYMAPQEIQDDLDIRVVLCKDAISTGWDCPRAEVLVSLRRAEDYTYIAQLIGRMVRTPLARRIVTDQELNTVNCYLPYFNKVQVAEIVSRFRSGENDEPPVEAITKPVRTWRNPDVPDEVFTLMSDLPSYVVPGKAYRTQIARLFKFATLLSGDSIIEDAIKQARVHLMGILDAQRERLESDGTFQKTLRQIQSLKIERSYALLAVEDVSDLPDVDSYEMFLDAHNVDDLFRVAKRKLPEGLAVSYWNRTLDRDDSDGDPTEAKAVVAALALHAEVVESVESAAEQLVRSWLRSCQRSISALPDSRRVAYEPIKREARNAEPTDLIVPESTVVSDCETRWPRHILCADDFTFPSSLRGWEPAVLEAELADEDLVAWYRNPTSGPGALRVPYQRDGFQKPMYPDFILFHQTDDGIKPSIIDPHGYHLDDATAKLKGLVAYAREHGSFFARIEAVAELPNRGLVALDLKSESICNAVERHTGSVESLFEAFAANFR